MDKKILVEIFLPAASRKYDVYIPLDSQIREVTALAAAALTELSRGKFKADGQNVLSMADSGTVLDGEMTVSELGLVNGDRLMLL